MAWTAPMTAVATQVFTATQFNTHIRDNLLETEAAIATTAGAMFWTVGANDITERTPISQKIATDESTTSTSFADLATVGPAVTVDTGTTALVFYSATVWNSGANNLMEISYEISGATTVAASSANAAIMDGVTATDTPRISSFNVQTGLNPGSHAFSMKYRTSAGTAHFLNRELVVIPI